MANNTSQHILGTATNLLGFCLFVITSLHIRDQTEASIIDELSSIIAVALTFSCFFSFISIKTRHNVLERRFELIADSFFIVSLLGILFVIFLIAFNFI